MNKIKKNQLGVTLIELVLVISIIGIMAAVAVVSFSSSKVSARLKATQGEVSSTIKTAQSFALQGRAEESETVCGYGFHFTDNDSYEIYLSPLDSGEYDNCTSQNQDFGYRHFISQNETPVVSGETYDLPESVVLANPTAEGSDVFFDIPHGNAYGQNGIEFSGQVYVFECPEGSGVTRSITLNDKAFFIED